MPSNLANRDHVVAAVLLLILAGAAPAASGPQKYLAKPDDWFAGEDAKRIAANILSHQADLGGWPKNIDTTAAPYRGDRKDLKPTFDNDATTDELRFLARMFAATKDDVYRKAVEKGVDYILQAQYPSGGWPQFAPPPEKTYHRHITFNDHAMVRLMRFLRETYTSKVFDFLGADRHKAARRAFDRGVECILKCQIKVDGKLTVWCAQHDEKDYSPRPGRTYELVSLSGGESVEVVRFLMSLESSPEVVAAVEGAVAWFEASRIKGIRVTVEKDDRSPTGRNRVVVKDPSAPPMWARFYDIKTNRPIFADRDGVPKSELADIGYERRNGYSWLGYWPQKLLDQDYPAWKKKQAGKEEPPRGND
jgi:pectate lyase